jgi:hypothetical protein
MDGSVAQEQLQRIPAGPQNLTAETFELITSEVNVRIERWAPPNEQAATNPPARTNAFVAELFCMQAEVLETALAVQ